MIAGDMVQLKPDWESLYIESVFLTNSEIRQIVNEPKKVIKFLRKACIIVGKREKDSYSLEWAIPSHILEEVKP